MKLTLTRKIFLGYFIMICLVLVEGFYAVYELNRLNRQTRSMVQGEVFSMDLEKRLLDLFLSQVGNEKKYLVVHDRDFLSLALSKGEEFDKILLQLMAGRRGVPFMKDLEEIQRLHERHIKGFLSAVEDVPGDQGKGEAELSGRGMMGEAEVLAMTGRIEEIIRIEELSIARKMSEAQAFSQRAYTITIGIVASMGLFGLLMAWLMIRSIQEPIQKLKQGTQYISEGIFEKRILISSKDEFGDLARAFNIMTQRLSELEEMKREFIANMPHELRTPLTSIKAAASLMLDQVPGHITDKQKRVLCIIQEETGKLIRLINNVLDLSRLRAGMMPYLKSLNGSGRPTP